MDDLEDQLTTAALRMLVKDLLILFQAVNEGVINVLGKRCARASRERLSLLDPFRALLRDVACRCRTGPRCLPTFLQASGICSRISRRGKKTSKYPQCTHPEFKTCNVTTSLTRCFTHIFLRRHPSPSWGPWRNICRIQILSRTGSSTRRTRMLRIGA